MDTGKNKRTDSQELSLSFGKGKKTMLNSININKMRTIFTEWWFLYNKLSQISKLGEWSRRYTCNSSFTPRERGF